MTEDRGSAPAFRATGVVRRFRRTTALTGLDLELEPGRVTVLLGPNGAGKSTLMRLALGTLAPTAGSLVVAGLDPQRDPAGVRRRVGHVPDRPDAPGWMRIGELCRFVAAHQPTWDTARAEALIDRLDVPRGTKLRAMSKGQAMKAMLVLALAPDPQVLLLDEPFGGLDPLVREDVLRAILGDGLADGDAGDAAPPRTILCATHELDVAARIADRIAILESGRIAAHGTVAEVLGADDPADLPRGLHDALAAAARGHEEAAC